MTAIIIMIVSAFFLPTFDKIEKNGNNYFRVYLNEDYIGTVGNVDMITDCLSNARLEVSQASKTMLLMETDLTIDGREELWGEVDSEKTILENMKKTLQTAETETINRSYTVKINEFTVNLASSNEVKELLQTCIDKYDSEAPYEVSLVMNPERELNVLTTEVKRVEEILEEKEVEVLPSAGVDKAIKDALEDDSFLKTNGFEELYYGILNIDYADRIEIVEAYLPQNEITSLEEAIELVTKDQEKEEIYEVVSGDSLSKIAMNTGLTIDQIIEMNENIESETSLIRIGDAIVITVPQPELSVAWSNEVYYEESYDAETKYELNDDWYTTKYVVLQQPSAGYRKVAAVVEYENDKEINRTIVQEELVRTAIPMIVEKGTKIPPTYIRPVSGGRISSPFGYRVAPKKGASTYHKGVDFAIPTGTSVMASCSGTVAKAGWGGGYGYVIYINHVDGTQTRYAHLSKMYVSVGQRVSQGQKIASSGSTGMSTGPHLHFEMRINGVAVNPIPRLD
jgi:murein DD-endopeptidase MepM/ murein hydrolase activator NlpD